MRDLVFEPAWMTDTRLDGRDLQKVNPMAGSRDAGWRPISVDASCKFGGGGFTSSALDLARFGQALWNGSLLDADGLERAMTPFRTQDGEVTYYGWGMDTNSFESNGERVLWGRHSGGSPGGRAFIVVLPNQRVSVALVANADGPSLRIPATSIAYRVAGVRPP
jgi:CubicO group peptidase (beta-lactamase class C family)